MNETARTAFLTGGGSGLGRATVDWLLEEGWNVAVADVNADAVRALKATFAETDLTARTLVLQADVSSEPEIKGAIEQAANHFDRLDAVINNAGVGGAFGPITELEVEDWDYTFAVVSRGVFLGTKHGARMLKASGRGGAIVNVGSLAGISGGAGPAAYSAAKAAVINFTRSVAVELAADRIRVNSVSPGFIPTPIVRGPGLAVMQSLPGGIQPWPEAGIPANVASVIGFLVSPGSVFVTGESINIDGGVTAAGPGLGDKIGGSPAARGLVGVARGSTGQPTVVRRRPGQDDRAASSASA